VVRLRLKEPLTQAKTFEGLAEELKKPQARVEVSVEITKAASRRVAIAVEAVVHLPSEQRGEVLEKAASVVGTSLAPEEQNTARFVVQSLDPALANDTPARQYSFS
jgi:hypothetical protein